jgi:hypothetical protein
MLTGAGDRPTAVARPGELDSVRSHGQVFGGTELTPGANPGTKTPGSKPRVSTGAVFARNDQGPRRHPITPNQGGPTGGRRAARHAPINEASQLFPTPATTKE